MSDRLIEEKIAGFIAPVIEQAGFRLVQVQMTSDRASAILRVMAENPQTQNLGVDECARLSREVAAILDVEDPIKGAYRLEISSPGIDRPLVSAQDFIEYTGYEAKVEIDPPLEGQKRFRGYLQGMEGDQILLETEDQGNLSLPYHAVRKAKLVLTDELLERTRKEKEAAAAAADNKNEDEEQDEQKQQTN